MVELKDDYSSISKCSYFIEESVSELKKWILAAILIEITSLSTIHSIEFGVRIIVLLCLPNFTSIESSY